MYDLTFAILPGITPDEFITQLTLSLPLKKDKNIHKCNCTLVGGLCLPPNYRNDVGISYPITPSAQAHIVRFPESDKDVDSAFFKEHFEASAYMCTVSFLSQLQGRSKEFQLIGSKPF